MEQSLILWLLHVTHFRGNRNGQTYSTSGVYDVTILNGVCIDTVRLHLTIGLPTTSTTTVTICGDALPYSWNGNVYSTAGIYRDTLVNATGCDSIATLDLTVVPQVLPNFCIGRPVLSKFRSATAATEINRGH